MVGQEWARHSWGTVELLEHLLERLVRYVLMFPLRFHMLEEALAKLHGSMGSPFTVDGPARQ